MADPLIDLLIGQIMRKSAVVTQLSQSPYRRGGILYKLMTEVSRQAVQDVHTASRKQLAALFESAAPLGGASVIVGSLIDPEMVGNPHIQVHARQGRLRGGGQGARSWRGGRQAGSGRRGPRQAEALARR
ncbi:MAG: hypothetical protein ACRET4_07040 [Steroidobacteraceae bacterium]